MHYTFYRIGIPFLLLFLLFPAAIIANENSDQALRQNRSRLSEIRQELKALRRNLNQAQKEATTVHSQINLIDKEMALIAQSKGLLQREQNILNVRAQNAQTVLSETQIQLNKIKNVYAERVKQMYKYGKVKKIALLLNSNSFNQALIRYKYFKLIAENDVRLIASMQEKKMTIEKTQQQLAADMSAKSRTIAEKEHEEQAYLNKKDKKHSLLSSIKKNQTFYKNQISTKNMEAKKLNSIIAMLEKSRKQQKNKQPGQSRTEEYVTIDFDNFRKGKGKLPWPVGGKIISKFGKQYDPATKTSVHNSGVEIKSKLGAPVKCVFTGVVRMVTYLGGYGSTVIVDHGKGYYTVYSHLGEIYVNKNDVVETNQIIAQVGDSGSLAGSKLHFEIYGKNQAYNPQKWLRK